MTAFDVGGGGPGGYAFASAQFGVRTAVTEGDNPFSEMRMEGLNAVQAYFFNSRRPI